MRVPSGSSGEKVAFGICDDTNLNADHIHRNDDLRGWRVVKDHVSRALEVGFAALALTAVWMAPAIADPTGYWVAKDG